MAANFTVYDIPNVTVVAMGDPVVIYRITADEGYYIHLPEHDDLQYTTIVGLVPSYDFSKVQVVAEADLPAGADITGGGGEHETA
jgi:hypothetical protein